jgi:DNA-binding IclR family transcriptional regulator
MNTTLHDGLRLLEYLANANGPQALTHIAAALGMGNSKAHRLLQTLTEQNYVFQVDGSRHYQASIKLWTLGSGVLRQAGLRAVAESEMQRIMEATGESVHLSVLEGSEIVYVHKVESTNPVRAYSQIGGRMPAHRVATGKAILAFLARKSLIAQLDALLLGNSITQKEHAGFLKEVEAIRSKGFAINRGGWNADVYGVAAPILDRSGQVLAALGVSGPAHRFKPRRLMAFAEEVRLGAALISAQLYGSVPSRVW